MGEFTKTPWTLRTADTLCGKVHKIGPFPWRPEFENYAYVYVDGDYEFRNGEELRANAQIMTAAGNAAIAVEALGYDGQEAIEKLPQMVEALRRVLPFIDDAEDVYEFFAESVLTKECKDTVQAARAALPKTSEGVRMMKNVEEAINAIHGTIVERDRLKAINAELLALLRRVLCVGLDEGSGYLRQERDADELTQEIRHVVNEAKAESE